MLRPLLILVALVAPAVADDRRNDVHSYAEPERARMTHLALDLTVDFARKQLAGTATLDLAWTTNGPLHLDTRDLRIAKVEKLVGEKWQRAPYRLGRRDKILGSRLTINAPGAPKVRITYRTSPSASGLQWMPAKLTSTGKHPFMFSQSQAIHARSWVPLQDTPGIRFTYEARIRTPKDVVALMSANNDPNLVRDGDYEVRMTERIPSYLLAIAAGELVFKPISKRSGVWAEPPVIDKAVAEFADTEAMIVAAEKLYGPYRWGRYDLLVLPPSFPYGGMENPMLTFMTPTVLVGDKSLTGIVAHELAHSWSGNLVTNATWRDVWLNEGFTTYVEYRIVEVVYGKQAAEIELAMSQADLLRKLPKLPDDEELLRLEPPPRSDPDGFGDVAYEKGQWFLYHLEVKLGRLVFDRLLAKWFAQHAFKSVTTDDFVAFVLREIPKPDAGLLRPLLDEWLTKPGVPASAPRVSSARLAAVDAARKQWLAGGKLAPETWATRERIHFLDGLPPKLSAAQLDALDAALKLTGTQNGEYAERWYPLTIRSGYTKVRPAIVAFIERVGRRKLIMPIYRAFAETPEGLAFARRTFARVKKNYHPLTSASVAGVLRAKPARR